MKKILIFVSAVLLSFSTAAYAADIAIDSETDFDNSLLSIRLTTEAKYNQALSVVLYEGNAMGSDLSKIVQIADVDADENGNAALKIKLAGDVPSGEYVISVTGGGSIRNSGSKVISFVNKSELSQVISDINSATQANIKSVFETGAFSSGVGYGEAFELPTEDGVYSQFLSVRKEDYNNTFSSANDISKSLKKAQLFYDLNNLSSEADILNYIKNNHGELNVDIDDVDFKTAESKFAAAFKTLRKAKAITGSDSFEKMYNEALAISVINSSDAQSLTQAITKYGSIIGIPNSEYQTDCAKYGDVEINKALRGKNFESCKDILAAYKNRISDLSKTKISGGGGGGGSSGGSGAIVPSDMGTVYVQPVVSEPKFVDFIDLSDAEWAKDSIKKLAGDGIVSGYEDNSFKPNKEVTREEFITLIIRAFKLYDQNAECEFGDVSQDDWCYQYIASAAENDIISGFEDGSFGKGSSVSRQDAATILFRACRANSIYLNGAKSDFTDNDEISEYAQEAIEALYSSGIVSGFEDGSVRPKAPLTRAQAVKMIELILSL